MSLLLQTPRLLIREIEPYDEEGMFIMNSDPLVHVFVGNQPVVSLAQNQEQIEQIRQQHRDHGIGRWAIALKETNTFIGWAGFKWMTETINGHCQHYDFGYRLQSRHWGKGYATEATRTALRYGIDSLGFHPVFAMADPDNTASRKVLEKIGFRYTGLFPYDVDHVWRSKGEPTAWYAVE